MVAGALKADTLLLLTAVPGLMKNFPDEPNYFLESFRVLDPENLKLDKPLSASKEIDLQILRLKNSVYLQISLKRTSLNKSI